MGLSAAAIVATPAAAQEGDFWSESNRVTSKATQDSSDDFWSTSNSAGESGDDFWASSSSREVKRRRDAVVAERRRIAEEDRRAREREERLRREEDERLAQLQYEQAQRQEAARQRQIEQSRNNAWQQYQRDVYGIVQRSVNASRQINNSYNGGSTSSYESERQRIERDRRERQRKRDAQLRERERRQAQIDRNFGSSSVGSSSSRSSDGRSSRSADISFGSGTGSSNARSETVQRPAVLYGVSDVHCHAELWYSNHESMSTDEERHWIQYFVATPAIINLPAGTTDDNFSSVRDRHVRSAKALLRSEFERFIHNSGHDLGNSITCIGSLGGYKERGHAQARVSTLNDTYSGQRAEFFRVE